MLPILTDWRPLTIHTASSLLYCHGTIMLLCQRRENNSMPMNQPWWISTGIQLYKSQQHTIRVDIYFGCTSAEVTGVYNCINLYITCQSCHLSLTISWRMCVDTHKQHCTLVVQWIRFKTISRQSISYIYNKPHILPNFMYHFCEHHHIAQNKIQYKFDKFDKSVLKIFQQNIDREILVMDEISLVNCNSIEKQFKLVQLLIHLCHTNKFFQLADRTFLLRFIYCVEDQLNKTCCIMCRVSVRRISYAARSAVHPAFNFTSETGCYAAIHRGHTTPTVKPLI